MAALAAPAYDVTPSQVVLLIVNLASSLALCTQYWTDLDLADAFAHFATSGELERGALGARAHKAALVHLGQAGCWLRSMSLA